MSQTGISSVWTTPLEQEPSERRDEDRTQRSNNIHLEGEAHKPGSPLRCYPITAPVLKSRKQLRDNPVQNRTRDWKSSALSPGTCAPLYNLLRNEPFTEIR